MKDKPIMEDDVFEPYEDSEESKVDVPEADNDVYDQLILAELQLLHNDELQLAKV